MHRGGDRAINFNIAITVTVRMVRTNAKLTKKKDLRLAYFILERNLKQKTGEDKSRNVGRSLRLRR